MKQYNRDNFSELWKSNKDNKFESGSPNRSESRGNNFGKTVSLSPSTSASIVGTFSRGAEILRRSHKMMKNVRHQPSTKQPARAKGLMGATASSSTLPKIAQGAERVDISPTKLPSCSGDSKKQMVRFKYCSVNNISFKNFTTYQ